MKNKPIIGIIAFFGFLIVAYMIYNSFAPKYNPDIPIQETSIASVDFVMTDINGDEVSLADFYGKPIVLNFWASWCPPCKIEMPHFQKAYDEFGDDVQFIMLDSVDGIRETVEIGKEFIDNSGYTFPVYFDSFQDASITYGINSLPTTFFIDESGTIKTAYRGAIDENTLYSSINLINNQPD